jgi:hypothetical protein
MAAGLMMMMMMMMCDAPGRHLMQKSKMSEREVALSKSKTDLC